jgi:hypothetical protein
LGLLPALLLCLAWLLLAPMPLVAAAMVPGTGPGSCPDVMVLIPGGRYRIGAGAQLPEEQPAGRLRISPFCLGAHEITNREFADFVAATGYRTVAERRPGPHGWIKGGDPGSIAGRGVGERFRGSLVAGGRRDGADSSPMPRPSKGDGGRLASRCS